MSSSLSVVVLFSDISRALYRVLVSTFPEINLLFGRGTSQAQQHQISVANNRWQSCKMKKGGAPSGQRAATQKRLRDKEEEKTPHAKTQRKEDAKQAKRMFFTRDTARQSLPNIDIEMSGEFATRDYTSSSFFYIYIYKHTHILPGLRRASLVTFLNWFHPSLLHRGLSFLLPEGMETVPPSRPLSV